MKKEGSLKKEIGNIRQRQEAAQRRLDEYKELSLTAANLGAHTSKYEWDISRSSGEVDELSWVITRLETLERSLNRAEEEIK